MDFVRVANVYASRESIRSAYPDLFARVSEILFRLDPIGINVEDNSDEYEPEVGTIIPRLAYVTTLDAVRFVVHDEFVKWFTAEVAGPEARFTRIAEEIWALRDLFPSIPPNS